MKQIAFLFVILFLSSCGFIPQKIDSVNCLHLYPELDLRSSLFENLSEEEITKRSTITLDTFSSLDDLSVISAIAKSIELTKQNSKLIAVDLRYYRDVPLGNIIIANIDNNASLELFLKTSKFSQEIFALVNFGDQYVTIIPPKLFPSSVKSVFKKTIINRNDLKNSELVINASNANNISGNMKFSAGQKVSILANKIKQPYRLDLREASNMQFNNNQKWIMSLYSIEENSLLGGKDTTGLFKFVNNKNTREIKMDKFSRSEVKCYLDNFGKKF